MENFVIIDGSSLLNRAFYAIRLLSNKKGIFTNGIYGFLNMLDKINADYNPKYMCVVFDRKEKTFRKDMYEEYKGNRMKFPDELSVQFPILKDILTKMGIKVLDKAGFEADDLAGTLTTINCEGVKKLLITGDKDYLQLIKDDTDVIITKRGVSEFDTYNKDKMNEVYGLSPDEFIDLKALMGDQSDNIPGIYGIGEKTALKILSEYRTIENLYEHADELSKNKTNQRIIEGKDMAFLSKKLATIVKDVDISMNIEDYKIKDQDDEALREVYEDLELNSRLKSLGSTKKVEAVENNLEVEILDKDNLDILKNLKDEFIFYITTDTDKYLSSKIVYITFILDKVYIIKTDNLSVIKHILESSEIKKVSHDIKKVYVLAQKEGIKINNFSFDTAIAYYLIDSNKSNYSIQSMAMDYLQRQINSFEDIYKKEKIKEKLVSAVDMNTAEGVLSNEIKTIKDAYPILKEKIDSLDERTLFYDIELPLSEALADMEFIGFKVDRDELLRLGDEYDELIKEKERIIFSLAGEEFNINSPKKLSEILFDKLGIKPIKKTKTGYSTDAEVLEKLSDKHPIADQIVEYRTYQKLKSTYIDGLKDLIDETGRIHSYFNQTNTATGRISSQDPNLQNIPIRTEAGRKIRKAFVSEEGYTLVDSDYSQIELRILAYIANDEKMLHAFKEGFDIHRKTASEVFNIPFDEVDSEHRSRAKAVNFGIVYGISDYSLSQDLKISRKEAKEYIDKYFEKFSGVHKYMSDVVEKAKEDGYVKTLFNRRRNIPELQNSNFNIRAFGERVALNMPIQGTSADIIKIAIVKIFNKFRDDCLDAHIIVTVHDEIVVEVKKEELDKVRNIIRTLMENIDGLDMDLKVDINQADNWYDAK
ncbi:DNA polymerase I [Fenollaria sporofastidiosus]|uniref:DNA polymerase I n=1 Tax=Fenollaria sporofastidiosus TaxID=2811778 RepID=UPI001C0021E8|nr:DNA polymerase I [Fenollaria sporofastidiosus]